MNPNRTPDQIEADINDVRERMDDTLDNLEQRLDARRLLREGLDHLRDSEAIKYAVTAAAGAGRVAREHPVPVAIAGAGLIGLVVWALRPESRHDPVLNASDAVDTARRRLQDAREALADSTRGVRRKARKAAGRAWQELEHAGSEAGSLARRHPVGTGIVGLALIAAAAAAVPSVRDKLRL